MKYFTSDLHLGSTTINMYTKRPWKSAKEASDAIISSISKTCKETDSLIHVGDFALTSTDRHGEIEDIPLKVKPREWISKITPRLFLLKGNHDDDHGIETDAKSLLIDLNGYYKDITVGHFPSYDNYAKDGIEDKIWDYQGFYGIDLGRTHIHLCGHVHNSWLFMYDYPNDVLNINIGLDVWNYKPVSSTEIIQLLNFIYSQMKYVFKKNYSVCVSRAEYDEKYKQFLKNEKEKTLKRRQERKLKKGLTPEECERRRIEGMKKRGLL